MGLKIPISRSAYKKLSKPELASFASIVAKSMLENPGYEGATSLVQALKDLADPFGPAVEAARDRSIPNVAARDQLAKQILSALDQIVFWMAAHYQGDEMWVYRAGFPVNHAAARSSDTLQAPYGLKLKTLRSGVVRVKFRVVNRKLVRTNSLELSLDNGESWQNGHHGSTRGIVVENLPSKQAILFRVCSLGTISRKSDWSETVETILV